jgi:hypothetical protein
MNRWRVGEDRGSKETDGCPLTANVDDVDLVKESMELINPIREVFFAISVFIISNLPGPS